MRWPWVIPCSHCGRANDVHAAADGEGSPEAHDLSLCWYCGAASVFTETGDLRQPTDEERTEIDNDPDIVRIRAAMQTSRTPEQALDLLRRRRPRSIG